MPWTTRPFVVGLRLWLLLLLFAALAPLVALVVFQSVEQRGDAITLAREDALQLAQSTARLQEGALIEAEQLLRALAQLQAVRDGDETRCGVQIGAILGATDGITNLAVLNASGDQICSARPSGPVNGAHESFFSRARQTRGFVLGDYMIGPVTAKPVVVAAYPVIDGNGAFQGVVLAGIDLSRTAQLAGRLELPAGASVAITDSVGALLAQSPRPDDDQQAGRLPAAGEATARMDGAGSGTAIVKDRQGADQIYAFHRFGPSTGGLTVTVVMPAEAAYAPANRILRRSLLVLSGVALFGVAIAWGGATAVILRPIRGLMETTARLAAGEVTARSGVTSRMTEVSALAGALDAMAGEVQRRDHDTRTAEERLRVLVTNAPVIFTALDRDGRFMISEGSGLAVLGRTAGAVVGQSAFEVYADVPELLTDIRRTLSGESVDSIITVRGFVFDTRYRPLRDADGAIAGMVGVATDITDRRRAEAALAASEARFRSLSMQAPAGIFEADLNGRCVFANRHWCELMGIQPADAVGSAWDAPIHPEDRERVAAAGAAALAEQTELLVELRVVRPDGCILWVRVRTTALRGPDGAISSYLGTVVDITERKQVEQELARLAFTDTMTGLANRIQFNDRLTRTLAGRRTEPMSVAVLFIDLDGFKQVNDTLGHRAGDQTLREAAVRLAGCLRPGDAIARFGGDEFAVLLEQLPDPAIATRIAGRMLAAMNEPVLLDGRRVTVTASVGVAFGQAGEGDADTLLYHADLALHRAKASGKNGYAVFNDSISGDVVARLQLEADLRQVVERDQLRVHYQPEVDLTTGEISAFEALVRWQHPERGLIGPGDFIELAEDSGLIEPIGRWVLERACRDACTWPPSAGSDRAPIVSVNLSMRQFRQPDLVMQVQQALAGSGLAPARLRLEITESMAVNDMEATLVTLTELRALGVQLSMDDFGTGYSSLGVLRRFPITSLKIDRSFIMALEHDPRTVAVLQAVATLGRALGMTVTAEGVETAAQLATVSGAGCDLVQGFYFSRPVPLDAVMPLLLGERFAGQPPPDGAAGFAVPLDRRLPVAGAGVAAAA